VATSEEVSGVNLDEEAANLIRYQQAYAAAAQVIRVTQDMFNALLSATSR
jgi:flagellar hook-associated protein 1 FlgK